MASLEREMSSGGVCTKMTSWVTYLENHCCRYFCIFLIVGQWTRDVTHTHPQPCQPNACQKKQRLYNTYKPNLKRASISINNIAFNTQILQTQILCRFFAYLRAINKRTLDLDDASCNHEDTAKRNFSYRGSFSSSQREKSIEEYRRKGKPEAGALVNEGN